MAVGSTETYRTRGVLFLVTHLRLRERLGMLLAGLAQAVDRNCYWFRSYVTLSCAAIIIYSALTYTPPGTELFTSLAFEFMSLALITLVLAWGRRSYHLNRQRRFPQLVMVVTVAVSFICLTAPALSFGQLATTPLLAGATACLLASIPMFFILIFPGTAFNPDFAHLGMFQRYRRILELGSGFFLFVVAAQQLVFYPQPIWAAPPSTTPPPTVLMSITPLSADEFLMKIAAPEVPLKFLNDVVLNGLAILLILFILLLATGGLYLSLAHRLWQRSVAETFTGAYELLKKNFLYRLTGEGYAIWPKSPTQGMEGKATNPKHDNLLERLYFSSSLPAVTLAFGLWTLRMTSPTSDNFLIMIVLVFFFAGGVWLRAIEVTGIKGPSFTFGLWLGTLLLYWPTTLLVVVGIRSITLISHALAQTSDLAALQNTFVLWYRAAVGSLTLLIALSRSKYVLDEPSSPRSLRYGLAAIALFVLVSFIVNCASQMVGADWARLGGLGIIIVIGTILFLLPQRRKSGSTVDPLGAQLIVSSSLAVAPLLFNQRIDSVQWTGDHADLVVKDVGISPKPYYLRAYVVGSEEEVGFEVMNKAHTQLRGSFDFVLTDLRTAIRIMGAHRNHPDRYATNYRILMVVATMPWKQVDVSRGQNEPAAERLILDVGYLRFNSAFKVPDDPDSPRTNTPHLCRPGSLSTVAYYAANHGGDVSKVYLTEPYSSWVLRQIDQHQDSAIKTESKLPVVYVLLARYHELTDPAVSYNWCRTMCEIVKEGQKLARENQGVINHVQLHKLHAFLQEATGSQVDLSLEDVQLALCRTRFEACFSAAAKHDCIQALQEMATHDLIPQPLKNALLQRLTDGEDIGSVICDALEHGNMPMQYDGQTKDDDFFKRFYQACSPAINSQPAAAGVQQYLHSLFLVSLPDRPGRLAELLQKLQAEEHADRIDLALVATENLGDSALVYLLDRQALPQIETPDALLHGQLLERRTHTVDGLERMRQAGVDAIEVKAFIIAVRHMPGSLHEVISKLRGADSDVNLEQVFAFPLSHDLAIALLIVRQDQQQEVLHRLQNGQPHPRTNPEPINLPGSRVELQNRFTFQHHKQQVTFDIRLGAGANVEFKCPNLATWTPTWGAIDNWIAEVGFDEVRLKIPTTLTWQIAAIGWMADIPLAGKFIKRTLQRRVPGIAGLTEYQKSDSWWMVSKQLNNKHTSN